MTLTTEARAQRARRSEKVFLPCVAMLAALCVALVFSKPSYSAQTNAKEAFRTIQTFETDLGPIVVKMSTKPEQATSFEPFELTVEIQKPRDATLASDDLAGVYGDFNVEYHDDQERDVDETSNVVTRRWTLYPQKRGELELPPVPIAITIPGKSQADDAQSVVALIPRQKFTIPKTDNPVKSIDDIAPVLEPIRQTPIVTIVIVVLAIIAVMLVFRTVLSSGNVVSPGSEESKEPPYDKAIRRLDELKSSRIYLENTPQFYSDVDSILREYLAGIFPVNALEKTTQEILSFVDSSGVSTASVPSLRDSQTTPEELATEPSEREKAEIAVGVLREPDIRARIESTLTTLDLVKFAKRTTSFNDASRIYGQTREVVEQSFKLYSNRLDEFRKTLAERAVTTIITQNSTSSQEESDIQNSR